MDKNKQKRTRENEEPLKGNKRIKVKDINDLIVRKVPSSQQNVIIQRKIKNSLVEASAIKAMKIGMKMESTFFKNLKSISSIDRNFLIETL